jgi:hypothetical protein
MHAHMQPINFEKKNRRTYMYICFIIYLLHKTLVYTTSIFIIFLCFLYNQIFFDT